MPTRNLKLLAIACVLAASTQARAEDVTFTGFANGSETVNFSLSYPDPTLNRTGSTPAGAGGPSVVEADLIDAVDQARFLSQRFRRDESARNRDTSAEAQPPEAGSPGVA